MAMSAAPKLPDSSAVEEPLTNAQKQEKSLREAARQAYEALKQGDEGAAYYQTLDMIVDRANAASDRGDTAQFEVYAALGREYLRIWNETLTDAAATEAIEREVAAILAEQAEAALAPKPAVADVVSEAQPTPLSVPEVVLAAFKPEVTITPLPGEEELVFPAFLLRGPKSRDSIAVSIEAPGNAQPETTAKRGWFSWPFARRQESVKLRPVALPEISAEPNFEAAVPPASAVKIAKEEPNPLLALYARPIKRDAPTVFLPSWSVMRWVEAAKAFPAAFPEISEDTKSVIPLRLPGNRKPVAQPQPAQASDFVGRRVVMTGAQRKKLRQKAQGAPRRIVASVVVAALQWAPVAAAATVGTVVVHDIVFPSARSNVVTVGPGLEIKRDFRAQAEVTAKPKITLQVPAIVALPPPGATATPVSDIEPRKVRTIAIIPPVAQADPAPGKEAAKPLPQKTERTATVRAAPHAQPFALHKYETPKAHKWAATHRIPGGNSVGVYAAGTQAPPSDFQIFFKKIGDAFTGHHQPEGPFGFKSGMRTTGLTHG